MKIKNLDSEQEKLIGTYQEKWRRIFCSIDPIDRQKATAAIKAVYNTFGKKEAKIRYFSSPYAVRKELLAQPPQNLAPQLGSSIVSMPLSLQLLGQIREIIDDTLWSHLNGQLQPPFNPIFISLQQLGDDLSESEAQQLGQLWLELSEYQWEHLREQQQAWLRSQVQQLPGGNTLIQFGNSLWQNLAEPIWQQIGEPVIEQISKQPPIHQLQDMMKSLSIPWLQMGNGLGLINGLFNIGIEASHVGAIDFCVSVLGCECDRVKWTALQSLVRDCGLIFPFEETCFVCDRPIKLSLDEQNRLHAEGEAAIQYSDGYSLYFYRGVTLPKKYGTVHPNNWQALWLLQEQNAELRRVLIQGIGYGRICQELQATKLDSWREYSLLVIIQNVDVEPIYLLKMTCPSTGHIHAVRVPPTVRSAREAIRWCNWDIDSEEFAMET
jgi:hypothetical protein